MRQWKKVVSMAVAVVTVLSVATIAFALDGAMTGDVYGGELNEGFRTYRDALTDEAKTVYDAIYAAWVTGEEKTSFEQRYEPEQFLEIAWAVLMDNPRIFWVFADPVLYIGPDDYVKAAKWNYNALFADREQIQAQIDAKVEPFISIVSHFRSEEAKITAIHNFVCAMCDYSERLDTLSYEDSLLLQTTYSVFVMGESVCGGYTRAYQYLCYHLGIPCAYVMGYGTSGNSTELHAWCVNKVNGCWFATDVTWDDCLGSRAYFNITEEEMSRDHERLPRSEHAPYAAGMPA